MWLRDSSQNTLNHVLIGNHYRMPLPHHVAIIRRECQCQQREISIRMPYMNSSNFGGSTRIILKKMNNFYFHYKLGKTSSLISHTKYTMLKSSQQYSATGVSSGIFIYKHRCVKDSYLCGCRGARLMALRRESDGYALPESEVIHCSGRIMVGNDTHLLNSYPLYESAKGLLIPSLALPKITLVQGVSGCGKTIYILKHTNKIDLILFATRDGAEDFRSKYRFHCPNEVGKAQQRNIPETHYNR